jgi:hypothetical protein
MFQLMLTVMENEAKSKKKIMISRKRMCSVFGIDQRFSTDGSRPGTRSWKISNGSWNFCLKLHMFKIGLLRAF